MKNDILKIVKESFDECISVNAFESILGIETEIEGIDDFESLLSNRLGELLKTKTISILEVGNLSDDTTYIDAVYFNDKVAMREVRKRIKNGEIITLLKTNIKQ